MISFKKIPAKSISYGGTRALSSIRAIVIHYTGNKNDTAENNGIYFSKSGSNTREAGAHFFIDKNGDIVRSIPMSRIAWSVGGQNNGGSLYGIYTNTNTVSIELCDLVDGEPSWEQMKACRELIMYIKIKCPYVKDIIRHWDITGKLCPATMAGKGNISWKHFHSFMTKGWLYKAKVISETPVYDKKGAGRSIIRKLYSGNLVYIGKENGGYCRLKTKYCDRWQWVNKKKIKEIVK